MPSIYKCVAVRKEPVVIKHELRIAGMCKEEIVDLPEPVIDVEALRQAIRQEVLDEVRHEAQNIISCANAETESMLSLAKSQAESIQKEAYELGKAEGYEAGVNEGKEHIHAKMQQEISKMADSANAIVNCAKQEAQKMMETAERQIVDIALAVARKLLAREIEENPTMILPIVKNALEKVRDQEQIVIRVSVDDFEMVTEAKHDLQVMAGCEQSLTVLADKAITVGSCVIDTVYGSVDARIDMQFEAIQRALREVMP